MFNELKFVYYIDGRVIYVFVIYMIILKDVEYFGFISNI